MELSLPHVAALSGNKSLTCPKSDFLPSVSFGDYKSRKTDHIKLWKSQKTSLIIAAIKHVRDPSLDKHVVKQNKTRFVQKLKTLLLSKPKHYIPLHILAKCRSYLSLPKPRSLLSMIHRYPTIFELFTIPLPPTPFNATKTLPQLCVRLTPAAASLASQESKLKTAMSDTLANKLQKLLMLSSHQRLLLSKLVHIGPDLGLPANFRSRLCNEYPDKFRTVSTSYGHALELVSSDISLAKRLPSPEVKSLGLIVDRPLKFNRLRLRKGLNVRRHHEEYLLKFREITDVCPYRTKVDEFPKESIKAEKRACEVVREILGMMVEKRTLVDHLTHFRKEFGFSNKLRAMLLRHPDLFYVSLKGQRDSVFLVEGYDDKGKLLQKDESCVIKDQLLDLVKEGKRMRRERRVSFKKGVSYGNPVVIEDYDSLDEIDDDVMEGLDDLFESDDYNSAESDEEEEEAAGVNALHLAEEEFWSSNSGCLEPW